MDGYMTEVNFDGATLTVRGKTKAARVALNGIDHEQDVRVATSEITKLKWRDANRLINGQLDVTTTEGKRYQLHFRRKQRDDFRALAQQLGVPGA